MCMEGKNCLFVCGCRDNAIQPWLHTHFHAFPYLTRAKIFHLPARSDCCVSFLRSFTLSELCLRHVAVNSALAVRCKKKMPQPSEERHGDKGQHYSPLSILSQCHPVIAVPLCAFSHHTSAGCIADSECQLTSHFDC